jgi:hypothetical protein
MMLAGAGLPRRISGLILLLILLHTMRMGM